MKQGRIFLLGLVSCAVFGWALGYLRIPFVDNNASFIIGFICAIALIVLIWIARYFWQNRSSLHIRSDRQPPVATASTLQTVSALASAFVLIAALGFSGHLFRQTALLAKQTETQHHMLVEQSYLLRSGQKSGLLHLMSQLLQRIETEVSENDGHLSAETIKRIGSLSHFLKPYPVTQDTLKSVRYLSPERGFFLLSLLEMHIRPDDFKDILSHSTFAFADLHRADLSGANLRPAADLRGADLRDANLSDIQLDAADLRSSNLWGVNASGASFVGADLKRADMRWSNFNHADFRMADLSGASLVSAQLRSANLNEATMQWANATGAFLTSANLGCVNLRGTFLTKAQLHRVDLSEANLTQVNFTDADLQNADVNSAVFFLTEVPNPYWLDTLSAWGVAGLDSVLIKYEIRPFSSNSQPGHRLEYKK